MYPDILDNFYEQIARLACFKTARNHQIKSISEKKEDDSFQKGHSDE